jgi:hypothetical protein
MYCLGRKAVKTDSRTLKLAKYLTPALPTPPVSVDWTKGITSFGEMLNDSLGDCTIAGLGHAVQIWSANTGKESTVSDATIQSAYEDWCGYNPNDSSTDNGGIELDVLNDFKKDGLGEHKLLAFADPSVTNLNEIRKAIDLFGGVYIGLNLPTEAQNQNTWDVVSGMTPGSWGGHAVFVPKYDADTFTCITWGGLKEMTTAFWSACCDEAHALIGQDWFETSGVDPTGLNLSQLNADLALIK